MRNILLYIAASLDGYIARADGTIDWLEDKAYTIKGEDFGYSSFIQTIDTTLMGHETYKTVAGFEAPFPYTDKTNYVFSRTPHPDTASVKFVSSDVVAFVKQLKQQPGNDIWLIGGGQLNTLLLNAGLIDEIILTYIPVILGTGIPLFAPVAGEQMFKVLESKSFENGFVQLRLKPRQ